MGLNNQGVLINYTPINTKFKEIIADKVKYIVLYDNKYIYVTDDNILFA